MSISNHTQIFRGTLQKYRQKEKPKIPHKIEEISITGDYTLTNERVPFLQYDNNNDSRIIYVSFYY